MHPSPIFPFILSDPKTFAYSCRRFALLLHELTPDFPNKPDAPLFSVYNDFESNFLAFQQFFEVYFSYFEPHYCPRLSPHLDDKLLDKLLDTCSIFIAIHLEKYKL